MKPEIIALNGVERTRLVAEDLYDAIVFRSYIKLAIKRHGSAHVLVIGREAPWPSSIGVAWFAQRPTDEFVVRLNAYDDADPMRPPDDYEYPAEFYLIVADEAELTNVDVWVSATCDDGSFEPFTAPLDDLRPIVYRVPASTEPASTEPD